ncbi:MAG: RluA family pseudouridine synthase [Pseudohongiellaceae bacterium]|nr:RluA family pseudouridine synthase [Pseudohongiellaceae bacterium]
MSNSNEANSSDLSPYQGVTYIDVGAHADGQRLDNFLSSRLRGVPKSRIYRLIRKGEIRINKKRAKPDSRLNDGDIVRVAPIRVAQAATIQRPSDKLLKLLQDSVIHECPHFIVIDKPQGLPVHKGSKQDMGLIEALRWQYNQDEAADEVFLELAHRIDRETTGCLVIAKTPSFLKYLQNEFRHRRVHKVYHALVHGVWPKSTTVVDAPLLKQDIDGQEKVVTVDADKGKPALTRFKVLKQLDKATLIEAKPESGRTHQIRVHCQYAGHPIVGDNRYTPLNAEAFPKHKRLCLHAAAIEFKLPETGETFRATAAIHEGMARLLEGNG